MKKFSGKKQEIANRLISGESEKSIAKDLKTTEGYVNNVKSALKKAGYFTHSLKFTESPTATKSEITYNEIGKKDQKQKPPSKPYPGQKTLESQVKLLKEKVAQKTRLVELKDAKVSLKKKSDEYDMKILQHEAMEKYDLIKEDWNFYGNIMIRYWKTDPKLIAILIDLSHHPELKNQSDFANRISDIVKSQFRSLKIRRPPVSPAFLKEEWREVIGVLVYETYGREYKRMHHVGCPFRCPDHGLLKYVRGTRSYRCDVCGLTWTAGTCYRCGEDLMPAREGSELHCIKCVVAVIDPQHYFEY